MGIKKIEKKHTPGRHMLKKQSPWKYAFHI